MSGARMAGIEDETVSAGNPGEHRVRRSWMGDALTLPVLKAALAIEIGERSRGFSQRRRAYFIITYGTRRPRESVSVAALPMLKDVCGTVSRVVCDVISV